MENFSVQCAVIALANDYLVLTHNSVCLPSLHDWDRHSPVEQQQLLRSSMAQYVALPSPNMYSQMLTALKEDTTTAGAAVLGFVSISAYWLRLMLRPKIELNLNQVLLPHLKRPTILKDRRGIDPVKNMLELQGDVEWKVGRWELPAKTYQKMEHRLLQNLSVMSTSFLQEATSDFVKPQVTKGLFSCIPLYGSDNHVNFFLCPVLFHQRLLYLANDVGQEKVKTKVVKTSWEVNFRRVCQLVGVVSVVGAVAGAAQSMMGAPVEPFISQGPPPVFPPPPPPVFPPPPLGPSPIPVTVVVPEITANAFLTMPGNQSIVVPPTTPLESQVALIPTSINMPPTPFSNVTTLTYPLFLGRTSGVFQGPMPEFVYDNLQVNQNSINNCLRAPSPDQVLSSMQYTLTFERVGGVFVQASNTLLFQDKLYCVVVSNAFLHAVSPAKLLDTVRDQLFENRGLDTQYRTNSEQRHENIRNMFFQIMKAYKEVLQGYILDFFNQNSLSNAQKHDFIRLVQKADPFDSLFSTKDVENLIQQQIVATAPSPLITYEHIIQSVDHYVNAHLMQSMLSKSFRLGDNVTQDLQNFASVLYSVQFASKPLYDLFYSYVTVFSNNVTGLTPIMNRMSKLYGLDVAFVLKPVTAPTFEFYMSSPFNAFLNASYFFNSTVETYKPLQTTQSYIPPPLQHLIQTSYELFIAVAQQAFNSDLSPSENSYLLSTVASFQTYVISRLKTVSVKFLNEGVRRSDSDLGFQGLTPEDIVNRINLVYQLVKQPQNQAPMLMRFLVDTSVVRETPHPLRSELVQFFNTTTFLDRRGAPVMPPLEDNDVNNAIRLVLDTLSGHYSPMSVQKMSEKVDSGDQEFIELLMVHFIFKFQDTQDPLLLNSFSDLLDKLANIAFHKSSSVAGVFIQQHGMFKLSKTKAKISQGAQALGTAALGLAKEKLFESAESLEDWWKKFSLANIGQTVGSGFENLGAAYEGLTK